MIRFPPSPRVIFKTMTVYYDESLNHDHAKTRKSKTPARWLALFGEKPM